MLQAASHFSSTRLLALSKKKKKKEAATSLPRIYRVPAVETTIRFQIAVYYRPCAINPLQFCLELRHWRPRLLDTSPLRSRSNSFLPPSFLPFFSPSPGPNSGVPVSTRFTFTSWTESFFITFKLPDCSMRS